jgi:hypothetical protein
MSTQSVSAIYTNQLVSGLDVLQPDKFANLIRKYGPQGGEFFTMLRTMSGEMVTGAVEYSWFEEERKHETIGVLAGVAAPGAGNDLVFTLDTTSVDANNNFYPRLFDVILFKNEVTGYIADIDTTVPTAPVITVRPNSATGTIPAVTAGEQLVIFSGQFSEGSGQPKGAFSKVEQVYNYTQIIKETITYTGTAASDQTWIRFDGQNAPKIPGDPFYMKGQEDVDYRLSAKISGALLFGQPVTNPNAIDTATGLPLRATQGLIPGIRERGSTLLHTPGTWTISQYDELDRIFDREGAGRYICGMMALNFQQENNNVMSDYFKHTNITQAKENVGKDIFKGNASYQAVVNFEYIQKNNRTFMFKNMPEFTNPKLYGAPGYSMPNYAIFVPFGETKAVADGWKGKLNSMNIRYKGLGSYSRKSKTWKVGSLDPNFSITDIDNESLYMMVDLGFMHVAANQSILVSPQ